MIKSKKIRKKNLRKRSSSVLEEEENEEETSNLIQEAMEIRKFRKRPEGMQTKDLSIGEENQKPAEEEEEENEQISKNFSDTGIVSSFKTQTNYMDTEKLMNKYIEDEIRKKRGEKVEKEEEDEILQNNATDDFNSKYELPDNLKIKEKYIKEDNVTTSLSMLTSIQEVDLGIENKLKNIEETEKARKKLEIDKKKKKDTIDNLIGVSVASKRFYNASNDRKYDRIFSDKNNDSNQNNKDNINKSQSESSQNPIIAKINKANSNNQNRRHHNNNNNNNNNNNRGGQSSRNHSERNYDKRNMATDDIAYERFKKRFRR